MSSQDETPEDRPSAMEYLQEHYQLFPKGIEGFEVEDRRDVVTVILGEPLDLDLLEFILERYEYITERTGEELKVYTETNQQGTTQRSLKDAFDDSERFMLTASSITLEEEWVNGRLEVLISYLNLKYVTPHLSVVE